MPVCAALTALLPRLAGSPAAPRLELPVIGSAQLPRDLSPWSMFMSADILVQAVMIGLVFASVVTWTVWLAKNIELWAAMRRLRRGAGGDRPASGRWPTPMPASRRGAASCRR